MKTGKLNEYKREKGPLQIVHDFEFVALNLPEDYKKIKAMKGEEKLAYMEKRLVSLCNRGYGGVVLNTDFKNYLCDEGELDIICRAAERAKTLGLRVWIYDEQYYPSGGAGGLTLMGHPELEPLGLACLSREWESDGKMPLRIPSPYGHSELKYALYAPMADGVADFSKVTEAASCKDLSGGLALDLPCGSYKVWCFFFRGIYEQSYLCRAYRASRRYINIFNSEAIDRFYQVTFADGYEKHLSGRLGDTVEAVFTDEPHFPPYAEFDGVPGTAYSSYSEYDAPVEGIKMYPYLPWIPDLPERYEKRYGEALIPLLVHLFDDTERSREVRCKFYQLLSEVGKEGFVENYRDKLALRGVKLGGHYYVEETIDSHPLLFGDILEHLGAMAIPGCDNLKSAPEALRHCLASKLASSAAHIAGKDKVMIEASNMNDSDQSLTLEKLKGAASMMFVHGVNIITSYYGENVLPPEEMAAYARHVGALASLFEGGKYRVHALLYYPFEQMAAKAKPFGTDGNFKFDEDTSELGKTAAALMSEQVCFDIINRKGLLSCRVCDGYLETANGELIRAVVLPKIDWVDGEVAKKLEAAVRCGVAVITPGAREIKGLTITPKDLCEESLPKPQIRINGEREFITLMQRSFYGYDLFMIVNTGGATVKAEALLTDKGNEYAIFDLENYKAKEAPVTVSCGTAAIPLELPPLGAEIIIRYS